MEPQATGIDSQQLTLGEVVSGSQGSLRSPAPALSEAETMGGIFGLSESPDRGFSGYIFISHEDPLSQARPRPSELNQCSESGSVCALHSARELRALQQGAHEDGPPDMRLWASNLGGRPSS